MWYLHSVDLARQKEEWYIPDNVIGRAVAFNISTMNQDFWKPEVARRENCVISRSDQVLVAIRFEESDSTRSEILHSSDVERLQVFSSFHSLLRY